MSNCPGKVLRSRGYQNSQKEGFEPPGFPRAGTGTRGCQERWTGRRENHSVLRPVPVHRGVPTLVNDAEERGDETVFPVSGRDAHVLRRKAATEGMRGHVQAARLPIEPNRSQDASSERLLRGSGVVSRQQVGRRLVGGLLNSPQQPRQLRPQPGKNRIQLADGHPRLVVVQQRVIETVTGRQTGGFLAFQAQDALQPGPETLEVRLLPGRDPCLVSQRRRFRQFPDQSLGDARRPVVSPPHLPDGRPRPLIQFRSFKLVQHVGPTGPGEPLVIQGGERGALLGPGTGSAGRHGGLLVPAEHLQNALQMNQFPALPVNHSCDALISKPSKPARPHQRPAAPNANPRAADMVYQEPATSPVAYRSGNV